MKKAIPRKAETTFSLKVVKLSDFITETVGPIGTPRRDKYEKNFREKVAKEIKKLYVMLDKKDAE